MRENRLTHTNQACLIGLRSRGSYVRIVPGAPTYLHEIFKFTLVNWAGLATQESADSYGKSPILTVIDAGKMREISPALRKARIHITDLNSESVEGARHMEGLKFKLGRKSQAIPDGEYLAKVLEIKRTQVFQKPVLELDFEVADGEHRGSALKAFINFPYETFSAQTKLYRWASVVLNGASPGDEIDASIFLDKLLRVRVEMKESRRTKNRFSNVTEILAMVGDL